MSIRSKTSDIIQIYINSKSGNMDTCEDAIVSTDHFVAIVDGATSKSTLLFEGKRGGKIASEIISSAIATLPSTIQASDAFCMLNQALSAYYATHGHTAHMCEHPYDRPTASLVIYSKHHRQLWFLGDCQAIVGTDYITNTKKVDTLFEDLRCFYLEYELAKGKSMGDLCIEDTGWEAVMPFIKKQTYLQNASPGYSFGYAVLDGFFHALNQIKVVPIPTDVHEITLASDGYPKLYPTLEASEAALKETIAQDPLCFRQFKSVKGVFAGNISFDDRSYVRVRVSKS